jgi:DNA-binding SARP family transcriptional activator
VRAAEGLRYCVSGPLRAWRDERQLAFARAQERAVLTALLLRAGDTVSVERLIDDVWGPEAPKSAVSALRCYVYWLRRALQSQDGDPIRTDAGGYVLHVAGGGLDLTVFEQTLAQANDDHSRGEVSHALEGYTRALKLCHGTPLADVPGPYAEAQRSRLDGLRLQALEGRAACLLEAGEAGTAAAELAKPSLEYPLRERLQELWMLALYRTGRRADALSAYRAAHWSRSSVSSRALRFS